MNNDTTPEQETSSEAASKIASAISPFGIARFAVGASVKFLVTSAIVSLVPAETRVQKAKVAIGGYALSGVLADRAKQFITDDIEEKYQFCREVYAYSQKIRAPKEADNMIDASAPSN